MFLWLYSIELVKSRRLLLRLEPITTKQSLLQTDQKINKKKPIRGGTLMGYKSFSELVFGVVLVFSRSNTTPQLLYRGDKL